MTGWRDPARMVARILAASVGGYALVWLLTAVLASSLPMPRVEAVLTSTMVSFLIYAVIIMAVFHARSVLWAWAWIAGASLLAWLFLVAA